MNKKFNLSANVNIHVGEELYGKNGMVIPTQLNFDGVVANSEEDAISKVLGSVPFSVELPKGLVGNVHEINPSNLTIIK